MKKKILLIIMSFFIGLIGVNVIKADSGKTFVINLSSNSVSKYQFESTLTNKEKDIFSVMEDLKNLLDNYNKIKE